MRSLITLLQHYCCERLSIRQAQSPFEMTRVGVKGIDETTGSEPSLELEGLGLDPREYHIRNVWEHKDLDSAPSLDLTLPPHGWVLFRDRVLTFGCIAKWGRYRMV